jgi:hypothetical protein
LAAEDTLGPFLALAMPAEERSVLRMLADATGLWGDVGARGVSITANVAPLLEWLWLRATRCTAKGIERFREARPACTVHT